MELDVTNVDLVKLAKEAYALSRPQGLGFLHATEGDLSDEDARAIVERDANDRICALSMDYVHGRACKLTVRRRDGKLLLDADWFDHSEAQMAELRKRVGF